MLGIICRVYHCCTRLALAGILLSHLHSTLKTDMNERIDFEIPTMLEPLLYRPPDDNRPVVVMTCGIAGSGKSTLAKAIVQKHSNFTRLSTDEIIFERHGLYGIDYPADEKLYAQYQAEQDEIFLATFQRLLMEGKDVVLDKAFYAKEDRDMYKKMIEEAGARWVLVYLRTDIKEELWSRICERSKKAKEANNALTISRDTFEMYWAGFEVPEGEEEVCVLSCTEVTTESKIPVLITEQSSNAC